MTIAQMQAEILRVKKERDICILAHSYQAREIVEIADFVGDSYALSVYASRATNAAFLLCGVRFMAETVKILSPEKPVTLANAAAGCPMAEQMDTALIAAVKAQYPDYTVVAYINTTAQLKTVCDVCVTSSSAVEIVGKLENDKILFIPDCNLGDWVAKQLPHKQIKLLQGGCPIHAAVNLRELDAQKALHPNAAVLVHPECTPDVVAAADYVGSTSGIMQRATAGTEREYIIGTELSIAEHLQYMCPNKRFWALSKKLLCPNMKLTTLPDVLAALNGTGGEAIALDADTLTQARRCIDAMIALGG
ncbi:MAG: quinolinate synthase NadA [Oscillospiraceae bacterium]|jgi:quinolinate synthase|nr:quinolinate synthase NadA [Oscillospiraceae bacterium]